MSASADAIPRDYNFAADILKRNLDAGRADKAAYIDHRGSYSYASLRSASSVSAMRCARSASAAKSAC